ncbi:MAG: GNAT family N-acetyltransferase [Actinomycetes bacterium]
MTQDVGSDRPAAVTVRDNPSESRFEVHVEEGLAGFSNYRAQPSVYSFLHTEIDRAFEGRGLGSVLVRGALDEMARRGLGVLPYCPFVLQFITRHAEYVRLVPPAERARFGLAELELEAGADVEHRDR